MKLLRNTACLLLLVLAFDTASGAGVTARSGLAKALAAAKQWKSDAILTGVSSIEVTWEGTSKYWIYGFYSPSTTKFFKVNIGPSTWRTLETRVGFSEPIGDNFIDSDKAMAEGKKNGVKGKSPSMGVNVQGTGLQKGIFWSVNGGYDKGDISVILEAATGKLHYKGEVP
jgi:hypothetical protein